MANSKCPVGLEVSDGEAELEGGSNVEVGRVALGAPLPADDMLGGMDALPVGEALLPELPLGKTVGIALPLRVAEAQPLAEG